MTGECNVARDLMPLCIDGAASKESEAYVNGHVAECEPCRMYYEGMRAALPPAAAQQSREQAAFSRAAARMKRRRLLKRAVAVTLALAVLAGGALWYFFVGSVYSREMPAEWYDVTLSQLDSGAVVATMRMNRLVQACWGGSAVSMNETGVWHLYMEYFLFHHSTDRYTVRVAMFESIGRLDAIEYGRNPVTIWRRGQAIPKASPEMEAYYQAVAELEAFREETERRHMIEKAEKGDYSETYQLTDEERTKMDELSVAVLNAKASVPEWGAGEADVNLRIEDDIARQMLMHSLDSLK